MLIVEAKADQCADTFLQALAEKNPTWMTYQTTDFESEEGRAFPYIILSSSSADSRITSLGGGKLKVWLQGGVHGNEPAGDEALLALLGKMDADQEWTEGILATQDLVVLPRYNPDGTSYFQRRLATNYDPNRDHIKLARQQTRDIKTLFSEFGPHIAVDMHEYRAASRYATNYSNAADGMYSAAKVHCKILSPWESYSSSNSNIRLESEYPHFDPCHRRGALRRQCWQ